MDHLNYVMDLCAVTNFIFVISASVLILLFCHYIRCQLKHNLLL